MQNERTHRRGPRHARRKTRAVAGAVVIGALAAAGLSGCGGSSSSGSASTQLKEDKALHDALPASLKSGGTLTVVMPGANPPWWTTSDGSNYTGAAADLSKQAGAILGVKVKFVSTPDISSAIASIASGRYQAGFGPYGDTTGQADGRKGVEFVDVVREIVPFLVPKGNPKKITKLDGLCGVKVASQVNGKAYELLKAQAKKCQQQGKPALTVVAQTGVPNAVLAVKSGRADAFFNSGAPLFYYAAHSSDALEVVGTGSSNGFPNLYQGFVLPKDSTLSQPLLKAFKKVFASGEYTKVMKKYHLDHEILDQPGIDLDKAKQ